MNENDYGTSESSQRQFLVMLRVLQNTEEYKYLWAILHALCRKTSIVAIDAQLAGELAERLKVNKISNQCI